MKITKIDEVVQMECENAMDIARVLFYFAESCQMKKEDSKVTIFEVPKEKFDEFFKYVDIVTEGE